MHTKEKGTLGEVAVIKDMVSSGIPVFTEVGDNSRVDLIVLLNGEPLKIQVKAYNTTRGSIIVSKKKSGPNYKFLYEEKDFDLFAVYCLEKDFIFYVPFSMFKDKKGLSFRLEKPVRKIDNIRFAQDYTDFNKIVYEHFGLTHTPYVQPEVTFKEKQKRLPKKSKSTAQCVTLKCSYCKKDFERATRIYRDQKKKGIKNFHCSKNCQDNARRKQQEVCHVK